MLSSESSIYAKVGGLADVVHDLSQILAHKGHDVRVILPYYGFIEADTKFIRSFEIKFADETHKFSLYETKNRQVKYYFIKNSTFFSGKSVYIDSQNFNRGPFEDDAVRFAFYSIAVYTLLVECPQIQKFDVLHCHDWHSATLLLLLKYLKNNQKIITDYKKIFTIHNLKYQGVRPYEICSDKKYDSFSKWFPEIYEDLNFKSDILKYSTPPKFDYLDETQYHNLITSDNINYNEKKIIKELYRYNNERGNYFKQKHFSEKDNKLIKKTMLKTSTLCFNPLRTGIKLADKVNTVSKSYAYEITLHNDEKNNFIGGCGLEGDLRDLFINNNLNGIINGINYNEYDPEKLSLPFNIKNFTTQKEKNKKFLITNMQKKLEDTHRRIGNNFTNYTRVIKHIKNIDLNKWFSRPLMVSIGRAVYQKLGILLEKSDNDQSVIENILKRDISLIIIGNGHLEKQLDLLNDFDNALFISAFDNELGIDVFSSGDIFFMPSFFEPCGISQLIAMRYGTLPYVNDIGGLHDTVKDMENGFSIKSTTELSMPYKIIEKLDEIINIYKNERGLWEKIQKNAIETKFDWEKSSRDYIELYSTKGK